MQPLPALPLSKERRQRAFGAYAKLHQTGFLLAQRARQASLRNRPLIYGNPNPDPHHKLPNFRPMHINLLLERYPQTQPQKPIKETAEKPKPEPPAAPSAGGKGGKGIKAAVAAFGSAMAELFPPPVNSGLRPVYITSMSIGGRRPEPD